MSSIALPAPLTRQFERLERRLWRMDAAVAITGAAGSLLLAFMLQFFSDRVWDTPHWLRIFLALGGWAGFAVFAWQYGGRWIWGRRTVRSLALIVQQRYRRLGDRLLGIVELSDTHARPTNYSPELCQAAIQQVAGEASGFDFREAANSRGPRRQFYTFLALASLAGVVWAIAPAASWNALARWLWPAADVTRYTFVTITALPDHLVVAQGEPFEIAVGLARDSFWRPHAAYSHFDGQPTAEAPVRNGAALFHFTGQTQPRLLWLSIGDVTRSIRIQPELRPDMREIRVRLELPAYLHYPPQQSRIEGGKLDFLPGTTAVFEGETVRDLASATLQGARPAALATHGAQFTTAPLLLELERNVTFTWRDTLGLDGPGPLTIHAAPKEDQPPEVELRGLDSAVAVLPEETLPIDLAASDDYGVQWLTLAWQTAAPGPMAPPGPVHEIQLAKGRYQAKLLHGHYNFSPALFDIPPDTTLLVRGLAVDYYPGREPASTPFYRIHVLSREAHARLIHDQFEKLMEQFEELTRRQGAILQSGSAVRAQSPDRLAGEESAGKLGDQSRDQRQTASQLGSLAAQIAAMLGEALRNSQISPDTLKNWAGRAEQMRALAATAMPAAAQALSTAQADAGQRAQKLDQALNREKSILAAMRQMQEEANRDLESMMAQTLAARLRHAAGAEREIAATFQKMLPETVGMRPVQLPDEPRAQLGLLATSHDAVTRDAGRIEEEIARLFDRTSLNRYGDVAREMDEYKTQDGLAALGDLVRKNVGAQSIGTARYWGDQFGKWADRLAEKDPSKASGQQGTGQPDPSQMEALLALMRLRQQQDQLREQTAALDERKELSPDYAGEAKQTDRSQGALRDQARALAQDPDFPAHDALPAIAKSMDDATRLLQKPETGKPTNAAQTDAINLLDAAIAQQAQKAGQNAGALMAMMGMGGSGSGNNAGGSPSGPNVPVPGSTEGEAPDQRNVEHAGGLDESALPGEFRDAIESYHRALEQSTP